MEPLYNLPGIVYVIWLWSIVIVGLFSFMVGYFCKSKPMYITMENTISDKEVEEKVKDLIDEFDKAFKDLNKATKDFTYKDSYTK